VLQGIDVDVPIIRWSDRRVYMQWY